MRRDLDFHIHTVHLGCGNDTLTIPALLKRCEEEGLQIIGIADHLNGPEFLDKHFLIKRDLAEAQTHLDVRFGVEVNVIADDGTLSITPEEKERAGFEFVIGGVHGPWLEEGDVGALMRRQHEMMMRAIQQPLLDVLVHPYWFPKGELDKRSLPWPDDLSDVTATMRSELAAASRELGVAIEVNAEAIFCAGIYSDRFKQDYAQFLGDLYVEGATFSVASDAHDISHLGSTRVVEHVLESIGVEDHRVWVPDRKAG